MAYDPAFAYEIAIIIQDGIKRMYIDGESIFYYLTVGNEPLPMPEMPSRPGIREGILKGLYRYKASEKKDAKLRAQLLGSGAIMFEVLKAQAILEKDYGSRSTYGASPATKSSIATPTIARAGTCCIPLRKQKCRM